MPKKMALVQFDKCRPGVCKNGICAAAEACPRKLITQEDPYDIPMTDPSLCKGCGDCANACPAKAIMIMDM
jgi:translation initiation factor RLI1